MRLGLISAAYPPDLDGIGDYTWWLAKTLADGDDVEKPVIVFTRNGDDHTPAPGVEVVPFFHPARGRTFTRLLDFFSPTTNLRVSTFNLDWLILQYNPFSWGRRGYCPRVPATLRGIRSLPSSPPIAVMFHETTVPRWPWRFSLMYTWQSPILRAICRTVDMAFVSTERWTPEIQRVAPHLPIAHLPVGSNIPRCTSTRSEARTEIGIDPDALIVGVFGSAHPSRLLSWIGAAARAITAVRRKVSMLYVGPHGSLFREACRGVELIDAGRLSAEKAGLYFQAMDAALSPFFDGMSTRRTSVISLLQFGIPVATTRTPWTDRLFSEGLPEGLLLSAAKSEDGFARDVEAWLPTCEEKRTAREGVREFHDRHFEWQGIARQLLKHLR